MKKLWIVAALVAGLVAAAALYFWYWMGQPLYVPGMVRAGKNLSYPLVSPPQPRVSEYWQVEPNIRLFRWSHGIGNVALVVHGGPGIPFAAPLRGLRPLEQGHEFIYYDQRGCGRSTRPFDRFASSNYSSNLTVLERTLGIGAQVADIERIRLILAEPKLLLIGHSFGALLASMYAAEFPERVKALILVAPADMLLMPVKNDGLLGTVRDALPASVREEYSAWLTQYMDFRNIFSRSEAELVALNGKFATYYEAAARGRDYTVPELPGGAMGGWMVQAMYFSMGRRHDYRQALRAVQAPVLVIHGDQDLQAEAESRIYAEAFPNARFEIIRHAGHFPFEDQPAQFADVVRNFLR
jgi:proline iminopeptidase